MDILKLISSENYITVNKELIKAVGLEEAIILGELASEHSYWKTNNGLTEDGYFYSTIQNIEEKTSLSEHKQKQAFKKLKDLGLIDITVRGLPAKRFIKIFDEEVLKLFRNKFPKNSETCTVKIQKQEPENFNTNNNITNNNICNNNIVVNNNEETSSSKSVVETTQPVKQKRLTRKDQLTEYVESLTIQKETKDSIFKWIFQIGLNRGVTVEQLKEMLNSIWLQSDKNESLVRESINQSYLKNWFGFFPVKNVTPVSKPTTTNNRLATPEKPSSTPQTIIIDGIECTVY